MNFSTPIREQRLVRRNSEELPGQRARATEQQHCGQPKDEEEMITFTIDPPWQGERRFNQQPPAQSNNKKQMETFTQFPNIPIELRLRVWKQIAQVPRNVGVYPQHGPTRRYQASYNNPTGIFCFRGLGPPPAILHVNREAREQGLCYYKLDFGVVISKPCSRYSTPAHIYVNWKLDRVVYFDRQNSSAAWADFKDCCIENKLRYLALDMSRSLDRLEYDWKEIKKMASEEIILFGGGPGRQTVETLEFKDLGLFERVSYPEHLLQTARTRLADYSEKVMIVSTPFYRDRLTKYYPRLMNDIAEQKSMPEVKFMGLKVNGRISRNHEVVYTSS